MVFEEVFGALNKARVKYLLIGGYAAILHGAPRSTRDIDIAVSPTGGNLRKCIRALKTAGLRPDTESVEYILGQGGVTFENGTSVDVVTDLPGKMRFEDLWKRRDAFRFRGILIKVISKKDLIRIMTTLNRPQDREDMKHLA